MKGAKLHTGNGVNLLQDTAFYMQTFTEEEIKSCKRILKGKTDGQIDYIEAIDRSVITICDGVAGTGKTYIAVAKVVEWLEKGLVNKILLSRPAVECGRGLGYLPGEQDDKFKPYTGPFFDGLKDFLHERDIENYIKNKIIEFVPLEYMRGMTFKKTAMVLDEAQNVAKKQLKMFMTRIGIGSRMIMVGDTSQCDLPERDEYFSYVVDTFDKKPYVDGIEVVYLDERDIVRHGIIQKIIERIGE